MKVDWFTYEVDASINLDSAGIYEWKVEGIGLYIGKTDRKICKRIARYPRNVGKMLEGKAWHGNKFGRGYRPIHEALLIAHNERLPVTVTVLQTCSAGEALDLEREWKARRRAEAHTGGPMVLNGTEGRLALSAYKAMATENTPRPW